MNLQERQNLPKLWLYSFAVTNKAFTRLLMICIVYLLVGFVIYQILKTFGRSLIMFLAPFFMTSSKISLILNMLAFIFAIWALMQLYSKFFITIGTRLIGQEAEQQRSFLLETIFDSIKPAIFAVIAGIIAAIPALLVAVPMFFLLRDANPHVAKLVEWFVRMILFFTIYIRLTYAQAFIMLKDFGPIDGLVASWRMTRGMKYLDTFLMWLMFAGTAFIYGVLAVCLVRVLHVVIPLHLASFFDLSKTWIGWVVLFIILFAVVVFCFCQVWTFLFITFLNRYYTNDGGAFVTDPRDHIVPPTNFTPLPAVEVPDVQPVPVEEMHVEEGLPPTTERMSASQQVAAQQTQAAVSEQAPQEITGVSSLGSMPAAQPAPAVAPKPEPATPPAQEAPQEFIHLSVDASVDDLQISQASINTSDEDANEITQHLNQVYTPTKDNAIQYGDEDRMPTILFDDEMAKELEKTVRKFADQPKSDNDTPPDPGSIKISK